MNAEFRARALTPHGKDAKNSSDYRKKEFTNLEARNRVGAKKWSKKARLKVSLSGIWLGNSTIKIGSSEIEKIFGQLIPPGLSASQE